MTKKEINRLAHLIAAEAVYGTKEHPVRIMALHDLALSICRGFEFNDRTRAMFLEACDLPPVPAGI